MRVAQSARQDIIRLAAGKKLGSVRMLQQLARSTTDIQVRWQIALLLDDADLLSQVALFKTTNEHLAPLRRMAHQALLNHLNSLNEKNDQASLAGLFFNQLNISIKIEIFLRF